MMVKSLGGTVTRRSIVLAQPVTGAWQVCMHRAHAFHQHNRFYQLWIIADVKTSVGGNGSTKECALPFFRKTCEPGRRRRTNRKQSKLPGAGPKFGVTYTPIRRHGCIQGAEDEFNGNISAFLGDPTNLHAAALARASGVCARTGVFVEVTSADCFTPSKAQSRHPGHRLQ
ncbi:hypothetical protein MES4922_180070 [Mesorhizobium ventifaucium]|uniref:Uncharacterized protein n=1 Tax=Mesorhizobium ventifaucium TaxID=666020 RepID=A0ABN8JIX3_9HYPH|nr:hypothetical protein MES4922_180070 [Mesorhizobium ventifaucium]